MRSQLPTVTKVIFLVTLRTYYLRAACPFYSKVRCGKTLMTRFKFNARNPDVIQVWLAALLLAAIAAFALSCSSGGTATPPPPVINVTPLTTADVQSVVQNTAQSVNAPLAIAVADRAGNILAVFRNPTAPVTATGNFGATVDANELAVALARTAAFFSNNQAPLSSRTVRFISGIHFPLGVNGTGPGDLYGIENTNRGCSFNATFQPGKSISPARSINGSTTGLGVITGRANTNDSDPNAVNPGGVPLFKGGGVVGGVGVVSDSPQDAEFAAFSGAFNAGFLPTAAQLPPPGVVIVGGIALPLVNQTSLPAGASPGSTAGSYIVGPNAGALPPEGDLVGPNAGTGGLTQADVATIIQQAVDTANRTRAVIRLPSGSRARMSIAVADLDGTLLALHRMPDGTVFSLDVAVAKARNVVWFSSAGIVDLPGMPPGTAITNRTVSFGSQPLFPPGIDGSGPGPFFNNLYLNDVANPCSQGSQPANPNQSGIVFFPGSLPLYKNGVLVGGLGVSGDGVDQDDYVTFHGAQGFLPAANIQADNYSIQGVRMPYLKFPRNPEN
jgi:uncharacterized protein GlcG (DUF336 family)